jgi:hypothetical protein
MITKEEIDFWEKDEILNDKIIADAIFSAEDPIDEANIYNWILERAKSLGTTRAVQRLIKGVKTAVTEMEKQAENKKNNLTDFNYFGTGVEFNCGAWIANKSGIIMMTDKGDMRACYHPILPIKRFVNLEDNRERVQLAFYRDGYWRDITVDKSVIASASKIVTLAGVGVAVNSETAKYLVRYLSDIENFNSIPTANSTSKLGWNGNSFIPFDTEIEFDAEARFSELFGSIRENGLQERWFDLVKTIRSGDRYEPRLCMSVSFASVLLRPLKYSPFIANMWGETGKGKTVMIMLAASIWADPSESKYITDSYSTQNAFEARLDILDDLPLLLDDMSKVRDKMNDGFTDLVYLLCSGRGKGRSNVDLGLNDTKSWHCAILSNMERPLTVETMRGGASNRILDFEIGDGYVFQDGNAVVELVKENFGFAGRMFVEIIKKMGFDEIRTIQKDFQRKIIEVAEQQGSHKEEKQVIPLSVILTADKIATDEIFKDGIYLDIAQLTAMLKDTDEVSEGKRGYEYILGFIQENWTAFHADEKGESFSGREYGHFGVNGDEYIYIIPNVLNRVAQEGNFSKKAFCSWADRQGLLKHDKGSMQMLIRRAGKPMRFYAIKWSNSEKEDKEEPADLDELPFD